MKMTPEKKARRKQLREEYDALWRHAKRQYHLQCAKSVLKLAPLPDFKSALNVLEYYDSEPSKERLDFVRQAYKRLTKHPDYGYTACGEILYGLRYILYSAIHPTNSCMSCDTQRFEEACWCAAEAMRVSEGFPGDAMTAQDKRHSQIWKETFGALFEKHGSEDEYMVLNEEKAA